jgi:DNA-binding response OmpR family regulator
MRRLRDKLGPASKYLETVRGVGYRFLVENN